MNNFFETLYQFIDERLEQTFNKLWKTKEYKELNKKHGIAFNDLYENQNLETQTKIELLQQTLNDLKEEEKYHIYLTGFADGLELDEYLRNLRKDS